MDLPTIIESQKTIDNKTFYKTADICQILICKVPVALTRDFPVFQLAGYRLDIRPNMKLALFQHWLKISYKITTFPLEMSACSEGKYFPGYFPLYGIGGFS